MSLKRWKLIIEYDGTNYSGWQRQNTDPSIQQAIEEAITKFCQQKISITAAGRTDAGVHACGQVAHFDLDYGDRPLSGHDLAKALNAHLRPHPVAILQAEIVDSNFHARFSATNKTYRYQILNRPGPATFQRTQVWHVKHPLDAEKMHDAAQVLIGHHDFTTFRDSQCQSKAPEKTLDRLDVRRQGDLITIEAEARSFLHHQIRNFAGTLALVGQGRWTAQQVREALEAKDRTKGGPTAPPSGLFLFRVDY